MRLTFEYEGSEVKLVSSQKVEMILPPTHPLEGGDGETGFWFTLSDAAGKAVYRRVVHNPIQLDREVFSNDPKNPSVHRVPVEKPKGTFVLLVPDVPQAQTLQLFSHPLNVARRAEAAREVARFNLTEQQAGGEKKK
jgi:hypothetical protein